MQRTDGDDSLALRLPIEPQTLFRYFFRSVFLSCLCSPVLTLLLIPIGSRKRLKSRSVKEGRPEIVAHLEERGNGRGSDAEAR